MKDQTHQNGLSSMAILFVTLALKNMILILYGVVQEFNKKYWMKEHPEMFDNNGVLKKAEVASEADMSW
jgi:hypothetical protein